MQAPALVNFLLLLSNDDRMLAFLLCYRALVVVVAVVVSITNGLQPMLRTASAMYTQDPELSATKALFPSHQVLGWVQHRCQQSEEQWQEKAWTAVSGGHKVGYRLLYTAHLLHNCLTTTSDRCSRDTQHAHVVARAA